MSIVIIFTIQLCSWSWYDHLFFSSTFHISWYANHYVPMHRWIYELVDCTYCKCRIRASMSKIIQFSNYRMMTHNILKWHLLDLGLTSHLDPQDYPSVATREYPSLLYQYGRIFPRTKTDTLMRERSPLIPRKCLTGSKFLVWNCSRACLFNPIKHYLHHVQQ